jgi:hypothetical protein
VHEDHRLKDGTSANGQGHKEPRQVYNLLSISQDERLSIMHVSGGYQEVSVWYQAGIGTISGGYRDGITSALPKYYAYINRKVHCKLSSTNTPEHHDDHGDAYRAVGGQGGRPSSWGQG